jgi:DNA-binding NarL/FixJ family response regulator
MLENKSFTILLVDAHPFFRRGASSAIKDIWEAVQVHHATNFVDACEKLSKIKIDLVITEIDLQPQNGIELIKAVKKHFPETRIMVLTHYKDEDHILKVYNLEVDGYLDKSVNQMELARAINKVINGEKCYSRQNSTLVNARIRFFKSLNTDENFKKFLSHKNYKEIVFLMAHGFKNKAIAEILYLSDRTTSVHRSDIFKLTGCKSSLDLVAWAIEKGIKNDPELLVKFDNILYQKDSLMGEDN